jgi:hypothetical protein
VRCETELSLQTGASWFGTDKLGKARRGSAGYGVPWQGAVRPGLVRSGRSRRGKGGWSVYAGQPRFSIQVEPTSQLLLTGRFHQGRSRSGYRLRRCFPSGLLRRRCPCSSLDRGLLHWSCWIDLTLRFRRFRRDRCGFSFDLCPSCLLSLGHPFANGCTSLASWLHRCFRGDGWGRRWRAIQQGLNLGNLGVDTLFVKLRRRRSKLRAAPARAGRAS